MTSPQQVWPPNGLGVSPGQFVILLVAEGYTDGQQDVFAELCDGFATTLLNTPPFGLLRGHPGRIGVFRLFTISPVPGPALGTTPGNTTLGSTYDPATGSLHISEDDLIALLLGDSLPGFSGYPGLTYLADHSGPQRAGLVAVVTPGSAGTTPISADLDPDPGYGDSRPAYIVTTASDGWERVVIRAAARALGLGDEFALPDDGHAALPPGSGAAIDAYPNLFVPSVYLGPPPTENVPVPSFKWFGELSQQAASNKLTVVPYGTQSPTPQDPIQLFEGGAGYRSGVYRSAADCFMRRQIGGPPVSGEGGSPRGEFVPFCFLCRLQLVRVIHGSQKPEPRISLQHQRLTYDQVDPASWTNNQTVTTFPYTFQFRRQPPPAAPWWEFDLGAGNQIDSGYSGLLITNLRLLGQGLASHAQPDVASRIEFRDIIVVLDDGTQVPFDFAAAFMPAASPVLEIAAEGVLDGTDRSVLNGIKLTLQSDLQGRCPVTLELSLTLKGAIPGADPGHTIYAAKFLPQIGLTWHKAGSKHAVTQFRGCVRMVYANQALPMTMPMEQSGLAGGPADAAPAPTVASFFTDGSEFLPFSSRRQQVKDGEQEPFPPRAPIWTGLFDYHKPDIQVETEINAVYGPRVPEMLAIRACALPWPPGSGTTFRVVKLSRQGAYDNLHVHGSMGPDPVAPAGPMVHAPGCAEACIHLHWRWSSQPSAGMLHAILPDNNRPGDFRGWGSLVDPYGRPLADPNPIANDFDDSPLIPPNQDLVVAVANPATNRADPLGPVIQQPGVALDPAVKAVWYTVDVTAPAAEARQVILEQGVAFAYRYNWDSSTLQAWVAWLRELPVIQSQAAGFPDEQVLHLGFSYLRWFIDGSGKPICSQVPTGDTVPPSGGVSLEAL